LDSGPLAIYKDVAPDGAAENYLPMLACRAGALAKAGAQIFFQPARRAEVKRRRREGAFKGGVVLPVREIGEVIFADCFRLGIKKPMVLMPL
jgi:hypothetical protein